jgi:6-phosphogluconolactonase
VLRDVVDRDVGVRAARVRHQVRGHTRESRRKHSRWGAVVDRCPVAGEPDEADSPWPEPTHEVIDALEALGVLGVRQLGGLRCGSLHEIGHADAVREQGVAGVAIPGHDPCRERCRPEAVARSREPHTGVGCEQARVQTAQEQAHVGPDEVGQRPGATRSEGDPLTAVVLARPDVEPSAAVDLRQRLRRPLREEAPGELVAVDRPLRLAISVGELRECPRAERAVQVHERPRESLAGDVEVARPRPRPAEGPPPEREVLEIGLHRPCAGSDASRQSRHGVRGVERDHGMPQRGEVQAGTAPRVESRHTLGDLVPEPLRALEEASGSRVAPACRAGLVRGDGGSVHWPYHRLVIGEVRTVPDVPQAFAALVASSDVSSIALSGGDTARRCYELLATADVDWAAVDVFFGDERWVPVHDPDSNEGMARVTFLDEVEPRAIHSMYDSDLDPEDAASEYDALLRREPPIGLVHLGLGPDGHTASLFPGSPSLAETDRFVVPTGDAQHPHPRLTFTLPALARASFVVVTVAGEDKRDAFARVQRGDDVPAARLRNDHVVWLVDPAASGSP